MKNLMIILLLYVFGIHIQAQTPKSSEHSSILVDRAFFISGEEINFSGIITIESSNELLSEVVYVELIDPLGNKINQQKYYLKGNQFEGKMIIPESTISGYYFIRAYTKWMRNSGATSFDRVMIKIVNPFLLDIQQLPDSMYLKVKKSYSVGFLLDSPFKKTYNPKEQMKLDLGQIGINEAEITQISLIPEGSQHFIQSDSITRNPVEQIDFYPETRGLSLSGTILKDNKPSPYHSVFLNVMGDKDFQSVFSDSIGRFYFPLPLKYDYQELMIGAAKREGKIQLLIDNDFEPNPFSGKVMEFFLSAEEEKLALQLAKQYQVNKWYFDSISDEVQKTKSIPFYIHPFKTIDFDYYIPLDSMSQYFTDISSYVLVKKRNGKRYLRVLGVESAILIHEPLLLVDWIPIEDAERILSMNPANIKEIDVINRMYYHGNQKHGGVIHIKTREGNMADLKFPRSNIYLNFQFPESKISKSTQLQFPGTAYNLFLNEKDSMKLSFSAPELAGKYIMLIQQIDKDGEKSMVHIPFEVFKK